MKVFVQAVRPGANGTIFESEIRVFWAWNAGKGWVASDNARMDFARSSVLYKLSQDSWSIES